MLRQPATAAHVGDGILELIQRGFLERILLSQNVDRKIDLKAFGGMGYTFVRISSFPISRAKGSPRSRSGH